MPAKPTLALLLAACLILTLSANAPAAEPAPPPTNPSQSIAPSDWEPIKTQLQATDEEWSVLFPQLWRIAALRDDLRATAETAKPPSRGLLDNVGPMGGTSLAAPEMPNRGTRGNPSDAGPFDPKKAPGAAVSDSPVKNALGGLLVRALIVMILPDQGHPVQTLLTELRTLLDSPGTPDDQLREKLATLRAVRNKAQRDLSAAQKELAPYLTLDQTALLVNLGILD